MTRRRWIADRWNEDSAVLLDAQAAHLARVLRARAGQQYDIVAGGVVRRGVIENVSENAVTFSLHEPIETAGALPLTVGMSVIRFERMEWAIEKLTELGVARFFPLLAQRSEKHLAQAAQKRVERWRKIARESAQQSRRSDVPEISDPIILPGFLAELQDGLKLVLSECEQDRSLKSCLDATQTSTGIPPRPVERICAAIGPEGGWTTAELAGFTQHGWQPVSLGPHILRAETAAISLASVVGAWLAAD